MSRRTPQNGDPAQTQAANSASRSATGAPGTDARLQPDGPAADALARLMPELYDELRSIAHRYLVRERRGHTLQTTALVHEAYLRLLGQRSTNWEERARFLGLAAQMMRRILVNHGLAQKAEKRGGDTPRVTLDDAGEIPAATDLDVVALHEALAALERFDARQARIIELRYFGGVSVVDTARMLDISPATVHREWATARMWLYHRIARGAAPT